MDFDECLKPDTNDCNQTCINKPGWYACDCREGYHIARDVRGCIPVDCGKPRVNTCPRGSYQDEFGNACKNVILRCPGGRKFGAQCFFDCPDNYKLAKIPDRSTRPFAKEYDPTIFDGVHQSTRCHLDILKSVTWEHRREYPDYYCRRVNDPPSDITISNTFIDEYSRIGTVVATVSHSDPQGDKARFTVQDSGGQYFFTINGTKLINTWVPNLNNVPRDTYEITIRASDNGKPSMWLEKKFRIKVRDANEAPYDIEISKNIIPDVASASTVVGNLTALDIVTDAAGNKVAVRSNDFVWELVDDDNGNFRLVGATLVLHKAIVTTQNYHQVKVKATDRDAKDPKSSTGVLLINVVNTNKAPFDLQMKKQDIPEDTALSTRVGKVSASDRDKDQIVFDLDLSDVEVGNIFEIQTASCSNLPLGTGTGTINHCTADIGKCFLD